jgi:hypothetical protein
MFRRSATAAIALACLLAAAPASANEPITPAVQKLVDDHRAQLLKWAANPVVVSAAKASNTTGLAIR